MLEVANHFYQELCIFTPAVGKNATLYGIAMVYVYIYIPYTSMLKFNFALVKYYV